jgi:hypothetical protein
MFAVGLADLLTIRRKQRYNHVYPQLPDYYMQELPGAHRDLIEMRLPPGKFSFNRLTDFQ